MSLLELDPAAWLQAGLVAGANLLALALGLTACAVLAVAALLVSGGARAIVRRRRTSRRAWRRAG